MSIQQELIPPELQFFYSEAVSSDHDQHESSFGPGDLFMSLVCLLPFAGKFWEFYSRS